MPVVAAPLFWAAVVGAGATVYGAKKASDANSAAAKLQTDAANHATDVNASASNAAAQAQLDAAREALDFQKSTYAQKQAQVAPYIGAGQGALSALSAGLGVQSVPQPPPAMPSGASSGSSGLTSPNLTIFGPAGAPTSIPNPNLPTLASLGAPTTPQGQPTQPQNTSGVQMPQVGERRVINGVPAVWDSRGWKAVN